MLIERLVVCPQAIDLRIQFRGFGFQFFPRGSFGGVVLLEQFQLGAELFTFSLRRMDLGISFAIDFLETSGLSVEFELLILA